MDATIISTLFREASSAPLLRALGLGALLILPWALGSACAPSDSEMDPSPDVSASTPVSELVLKISGMQKSASGAT